MNCYPSQDSACCLNGDVCLSNGLCYGSPVNVVRPSYLCSYLVPNTESLVKVYRGGCTVKDWSNTTACPTQWCDNGEVPFHD